MNIYLISFILLFSFSVIEIYIYSKESRKIFFFLILLLIMHDGLRWETGTDWNNYYNYFNNCLLSNSNSMSFSIGYVLLNQFIRIFASSYSVFLITHALIVYTFLSICLNRFSDLPIFSLLLYYGMMVPYLGMNRQLIALGLCLFSLKYLFSNKKYTFFSIICIASLFHASSLVFLLAIFLKKQIEIKYIGISFAIVVCLSLFGFINKIPLNFLYAISSDDPMSAVNKIQFYAENQFLSTNIIFSILAILKRSLWLGLTLFLMRKFNIRDLTIHLFFNLYFIGSLFYILFNNTILQIVVARGLIYFNIFEIFLLAFIITKIKEKYFQILFMLLFTIYSYAGMIKGFEFYKADLGEDIFRPYKLVLMK